MTETQLNTAAKLYNDLIDVADDGGPMQISQQEAELIIEWSRNPETSNKVRQLWVEKYGAKFSG